MVKNKPLIDIISVARVEKTIYEIVYDILLPLELYKSPSKVQKMAFQRR